MAESFRLPTSILASKPVGPRPWMGYAGVGEAVGVPVGRTGVCVGVGVGGGVVAVGRTVARAIVGIIVGVGCAGGWGQTLVIQKDGKIVAAGATSTNRFCVARLNGGGRLDTTFSGDDVKGFTKILANQMKIFFAINK